MAKTKPNRIGKTRNDAWNTAGETSIAATGRLIGKRRDARGRKRGRDANNWNWAVYGKDT